MNNEKIEKLEKKISSMNKEIDVFQKKVEKLPTKVNRDFVLTMGKIHKKYDKLESQFETFKRATSHASNDFQVGFQMAWDDLSAALDVAKERYQNIAS